MSRETGVFRPQTRLGDAPMDKMFYTMQEVCQKLGKSEDEVREMVSSGQLRLGGVRKQVFPE